MKTILKRLYIFTLLIIIIPNSSCTKKDIPSGGDTADKSEYVLYISSSLGPDAGKILIGSSVSSSRWDESTGYIYLGTDDHLEPLGTLTMEIGSPAYFDGDIKSLIYSATLSTTDKREGTSAELNPRLYAVDQSQSYVVVIDYIGVNFIRVNSIEMVMERVIINPDDEPETITLTGTFTALE